MKRDSYMLTQNLKTRVKQGCLAGLTFAIAAAAVAQQPAGPPPIVFGAPKPQIPEGNDSNGQPFQGPGKFPNRLTAANVDIEVVGGSVLGGNGSNDLTVKFPSMGPIAWTDARHNEGDIAFNIGPFDPSNPVFFPPNTFQEWAPSDGPTTYAWTVDRRAGVALATTRVNGFDNGDTYSTGGAVGTQYGVAYFTHGFRSGVGYGQIDGVYSSGNGSQDLVMGLIGEVDEASFSVALTYFPYLEGWKGGHVATTEPTDFATGAAFFESGSKGFGIPSGAVTWIDLDGDTFWDDGLARVVIPGADSATDGMLFAAPADSSSNTKYAGVTPYEGGWTVAIRDDREVDDTGLLFNARDGSSFSFVYVPWTAEGIIAAHVSSNGSAVKSAGPITVSKLGTGEYLVQVEGKSENNGVLILASAGSLPANDQIPSRDILSYEYSAADSGFIVQSRELQSSGVELSDGDFYVAWIDFEDPMRPGNPAPKPQVPEGNDSNGQPFQGPGAYPLSVTAANVDIEVVANSILGGAGSNDLRIQFPQAGPIPWTDSRHNEGDIAFNIGPFDPQNPDSFPPVEFLEWAPSDGMTTYAWTVDRRAGVALASTRANGFDNGDTFSGGGAVGTQYGVAYFTHGFRSGVGYSPIDGVHASGNGSQDLVMGMIGATDEASFNLGLAFFPFMEGWRGGHVSAAEPVDFATGAVIYDSGATGYGITANTVVWMDLNQDTFYDDGLATINIPGVNSAEDGLLLVAPADGSSDTKIAGAIPFEGGWNVGIRDDRDTDPSLFADRSGSAFSFVYIPWNAARSFAAHVNDDGSVIRSSGEITINRTGAGEYDVAIEGKSGETGMLLLSNAGVFDLDSRFPSADFLSYEYDDAAGVFKVQSRELTFNGAELSDTAFYVVYVDFNAPLTLAGRGAPNPAEPAILSIEQAETGVTLTIEGATPGAAYQVEWALSVNADGSAEWTALEGGAITGSEGPQTVNDPAGSAPQRFYRVVGQ
jgi:hypothetical protein